MDGIIGFSNPAENQIRITFDDRKTDPEEITQALIRGGVAIPGIATQAQETPFSYK